MLLDEIFIKLGFKFDDQPLDKANQKVGVSIGKIRNIATAIIVAVAAWDRMTNAMARTNQQFISFNQQTGISLDRFNGIAGAAMLSNYNLDAKTVASSLQSLESNLASIRLGQGNIAPFQMLGINPVGKDAIGVIDDLRYALRGVDSATATNLIQQMGLSPEMLSMLRMSNAEFKELKETSKEFMLSPEQRKQMQSLSLELKRIHMSLAKIKDEVLLRFMPVLISLGQAIERIAKFFKGKNGLYGLIFGGALAGAAGVTAFAFHPWITGITALAAALGLLLDDFLTWKTGGISVLGDFYESMSNFVDNLAEWWSGVEQFCADNLRFEKIGEWIANGFKEGIKLKSEGVGFMNLKANSIKPLTGEEIARLHNKGMVITAHNGVTQTNYITIKDGAPNTLAASITQQLDNAFVQIRGGAR